MAIGTFQIKPGSHFMYPLRFTLRLIPRPGPFFVFFQSRFTSLLSPSTTSLSTNQTHQPLEEEVAHFPVLDARNSGKKNGIPNNNNNNSNGRARVRVYKPSHKSSNQSWMDSLTCPFSYDVENWNIGGDGSGWVIGVDPDTSGALALLKPDDSGVPAQVFDSPLVPVIVGKSTRKRLDTKTIVQLLQSFHAPVGTLAFVEQSTPFPADGKQGWWTGGFNYGIWIGVLVASGFSVVPVPSSLWKNALNLSGKGYTKDDSRRVASGLFPSLSPQLKRKKDHGRAEALLIAAYGRGLKTKLDSLPLFEESVSK